MLLFTIFKFLHIAAGFLALFIFWIPIVTRKGGKIHHRVGWIYVWSMLLVSISALYMGVFRIFLDPNRTSEVIAFSWFLIFISMLSSASAWHGIRVLRYKNRKTAHCNGLDLFFPIMLLISGLGISIYGFIIHQPLITYFPIVGIFNGGTQLYYWLRPPQLKMHWLFEHLNSMLGCCISTITAFTVFGAPRILEISSLNPLLWIAPTLIIVPMMIAFQRYYRSKFKV